MIREATLEGSATKRKAERLDYLPQRPSLPSFCRPLERCYYALLVSPASHTMSCSESLVRSERDRSQHLLLEIAISSEIGVLAVRIGGSCTGLST